MNIALAIINIRDTSHITMFKIEYKPLTEHYTAYTVQCLLKCSIKNSRHDSIINVVMWPYHINSMNGIMFLYINCVYLIKFGKKRGQVNVIFCYYDVIFYIYFEISNVFCMEMCLCKEKDILFIYCIGRCIFSMLKCTFLLCFGSFVVYWYTVDKNRNILEHRQKM